MRDLPHCREKVYLVQDHEPQFFADLGRVDLGRGDLPDGLPLRRLHAVDGATSSRTGTGSRSRWFECGTDLDMYTFAGPEQREPGLVAVYARRETARRAVELALAGLATLVRAPADHRVVAVRLEPRRDRPVPVRGPRRRAAGGARRALPPRQRRRRLLADHPLARRPGDDGQRPAGGRARRRQRALGARRSGRAGACWRSRGRTPIADAIERLLDDPARGRRDGRARPGVRRGADLGAGRRPTRGGAPRLVRPAARSAHAAAPAAVCLERLESGAPGAARDACARGGPGDRGVVQAPPKERCPLDRGPSQRRGGGRVGPGSPRRAASARRACGTVARAEARASRRTG